MPDPTAEQGDNGGAAWHVVARLSELEPEYPRQVKLGRAEFAVCVVGEEVFAVANICSHAFARLSDGEVMGFEILCPLHGGRFDLRTGSATGAPCFEPIRTAPAKVSGDDVLIYGRLE